MFFHSKHIFKLLALVFLFIASACNTLLESADITSTQIPQGQFTNSAGEKVYRYSKIHSSSGWIDPLLVGSDKIMTANQYSDDTNTSPNSYSNLGPQVSKGYFDLSASGQDLHLGFHLGFPLHDQFMFRVGASMIFSKEGYLGFDASGRYALMANEFTPFLGLGGFLGDSRSCKVSSANTEECEKKFLGLGYAEFGLRLNKFTVFYRSYNMNRAGVSIPARDFFGIGIEI